MHGWTKNSHDRLATFDLTIMLPLGKNDLSTR